MTLRSMAIAMALVVVQGAVLAQTKALTACPWDSQRAATKMRSGGFTTMAAGTTTVKCNKNGCTIKVDVVSYTPANEPERCCTFIEHGRIEVEKKPKKDPAIPVTWTLVPKDNPNEYVFAPVNPIVLSPPGAPVDFESPTFKKADEFTLGAVSHRAATFNYELTVFRKYKDGSYLACDPNDPVIVNQGN